MNNTIENIQITKWQGTKNCNTQKTDGGYLWLSFKEDTTLLNVNPNVIGAKPVLYQRGALIGLSIRQVSNRKEAIESFKMNYQICH